MRLLGIDYGTKRIGIALSDEEGRVAFPHSVLKCATLNVAQIKKICAENDVGKIILGKSVDYQGRPNPIMKRIKPFKKQLEKETGKPVVYEEETFSTREAEEIQGKVGKIDASAAAVILQSFLEKRKVL